MTQTLSEIVEQTAAWPENKPVEPKYCEDCKFYSTPMFPGDFSNARCDRNRAVEATGRVLVARAAAPTRPFCDMERCRGGDCGVEAKYFEAKASSSVAA